MKKIAAVLIVFVLGIGIGITILQQTFDTDDMRAQALAQAQTALGRPIALDGGISFSLLPVPVLRMEGLRVLDKPLGKPLGKPFDSPLDSLEEKQNFLTIDQLAIRIPWSFLLHDAWRIENVHITGAHLRLHTQDKKNNWDFLTDKNLTDKNRDQPNKNNPDRDNPDEDTSRQDDSSPAEIVLRTLSINSSTITYCSAKEDCHNVAILQSEWYPEPGHWRGEGQFEWHDIPIQAHMSFDRDAKGQNARLHARIDPAIASLTMEARSTLKSDGTADDWRGKTTMEIIDAPTLATIMPSSLIKLDVARLLAVDGEASKSLLLKADWQASAETLSVKNIHVRGGAITAKGKVTAHWSQPEKTTSGKNGGKKSPKTSPGKKSPGKKSATKTPSGEKSPGRTRINADFEFSPIAIDALLAASNAHLSSTLGEKQKTTSVKNGGKYEKEPKKKPKKGPEEGAEEGAKEGEGPDITIKAKIAALRWQEHSIFDVIGTGRYHDGIWQVDSLKAALGPSSTIQWSGKGKGRDFSGKFDLNSNNLPGLLQRIGWQNANTVLSARALRMKGSIKTQDDTIHLRDIQTKIGKTTWKTTLTLTPARTPGSPLRADLHLHGDTLDIVMAPPPETSPLKPSSPLKPPKPASDSNHSVPPPESPNVTFPSMIDAHIQVSLQRLGWNGHPWSDIKAKGRLTDGVLNIQSLTFVPTPNVQMEVSGSLNGIHADSGMDLGIKLSTNNMQALHALTGGEFLPPSPLQAAAQLRGGSQSWQAKSQGTYQGGHIVLDATRDASGVLQGRLETTLDPNVFAGMTHGGKLKAKNPPTKKQKKEKTLTKNMVHLSTHWRFADENWQWHDLKGQWRDMNLSSHGTLRPGQRPFITSAIHIDAIDLDALSSEPFDKKNTTKKSTQKKSTQKKTADKPKKTADDPWAWLPDIESDVKITGKSIRGSGWKIENWKTRIRSDPSRVILDETSGQVNDGTGTFSTHMDRQKKTIKTNLVLKSVRAGEMAKTPYLSLEDSRINLDLTSSAHGSTWRGLRDSLSGDGAVTITGDMNADLSLAGASVLLGNGNPLQALTNSLFTSLNPERSSSSKITSTITIRQGVIRSDDLRLISSTATGEGTMRISLPKNHVRAHADLQFSTKNTQPLRIKIEGTLDDPFARLNLQRIGDPNAPKDNEKKKKKGLESLIENLLGNVLPEKMLPPQAPREKTPPPAKKPKDQKPKDQKPKDQKQKEAPPIVKDLIGNILDDIGF